MTTPTPMRLLFELNSMNLILVTLVFAPFVALLALLKSEGVLTMFFKKKSKYPPSATSEKYPGQVAGVIETIAGLTSRQAPLFVYGAFKRLPKDHRWIFTGNFPNKSPSGCGYAVADLEIAKEVLTTPLSGKSIMYEGVDWLVCGQRNIFTANGPRWKHARKGVAPAFSSNHLKRMLRICNERLDLWIRTTLDECAKNQQSFNLGKEMIGLTLSIIAEAAFEYPITKEEMNDFTTHLEIAAETFVIMNPLHQWFPLLFPAVWRARRSAKIIQAFALRIMEHYRQNHRPSDPETRTFEEDTIICRIINNPYYATDEERAADIVMFLAAGHDTTAYSISWTLLEITKNQPPELVAYRRKIAHLSPEEWQGVDELDYMIKEGMRLKPVLAMGTVRDVGKEITYQQGGETVVLPKDSIYFINLFPLFRNPLYYDRPDEYIPSRWINPSKSAAAALLPFSMGSRNCVGMSLANAELHTVLAVLCGRYDFVIENEGHTEYLTTLKPVDCRMIPTKLF